MAHFLRSLGAEFLGTMLLLATIVGSGIMGETLAQGNVAVALLANTLSIGAMLGVLITCLGPISGAHFNPIVTLVFALRRDIKWHRALVYIVVQIIAAILGVWLAHIMFNEALIQVSLHVRTGRDLWLSEMVASFGLVFTILATLKHRREFIPMAVGLYIVSACWFTASTSFANPAVTLARSLTDTFVGIRPEDVAGFVLAQVAGALIALLIANLLIDPPSEEAL